MQQTADFILHTRWECLGMQKNYHRHAHFQVSGHLMTHNTLSHTQVDYLTKKREKKHTKEDEYMYRGSEQCKRERVYVSERKRE